MGNIADTTVLNNGVQMPWLGFGTYKAEGNEVYEAVKIAIEAGYRSIDTAAIYGNEDLVGQAIRDSGADRENLFVTTKLWNQDQGYDSTLRAFEESRKRLGLDIIDLYLIHWPGKDKYKETWKAFERLYEEGSVRAIGVSNFQVHHLENLLKDSNVVPVINQVELHPRLTQQELHQYCREHQIQLESWSPLMKGKLTEQADIVEIAAKYGKTSSQVILRWHLDRGIVTIPKSVTAHRIRENADLFDFELTAEDINRINALHLDERVGTHPDKLLF
ncbi:aldo/keto reductase [Paenibacillus kribbensis]|uniref:Aldo/keto reductase n=1 Tax=Paenibacillus kribbensis TaxID=172713 RepID=A0A222WSU6_9BACL|nr:aldo/keto reductase [Paenibacillus kribbensis]ASR49022.1 aldo/keto reductase [Paenibacillus kribbensis]